MAYKHEEDRKKYYESHLEQIRKCKNEYKEKAKEIRKIHDNLHKEELREKSKIYKEKHKDKIKNWRLQKEHHITIQEYKNMFIEQEGKCAICGKKFNYLCVDHDHNTGKIRGLLCHKCNLVIGYAHENIRTLISAAKFLEVTA